MSGKDAILAKIKRSLATPAGDAARQAVVARRLEEAPAGIIPQRGQLPDEERVALFCAIAEKYNATIARIGSISELPGEVSDYLKSRNLPAEIRMGSDAFLTEAGFESERTLEVKKGASDGTDLTGLSHAVGAVAESGTLVLTSGADNPVTINFLPEHHIVVIKASDIGASLEEAFANVRQTYGKGQMPRTVNFVTGPSRSGDIEQTILLGAHGPRALHIVVVG
ncbi:lactate utilization protein [Rhizobium sp. L1K21]|uniref:LutC/YkgG family protein n=1 Tax=Rhizobium sp. L1K21 TaxID=2954933 RepID=UPI0020934409|nr:lactate utilization protein [Rhizobium sp. L1K21]MCO6187009.1 lactate utilization protein [Rhizobium sp. L1K21]